jgi:hydroxyacylglutathione hydrolase
MEGRAVPQLSVVPVPCLSDNYAYLVRCEATKEVAVVDPSEAPPVLAALRQRGFAAKAIWNTHHHHDHTGGNEELAKELGTPWVSGHTSDRGRIPGQTRFLAAGDRFPLGKLSVEVLHIPGHTLGAIAYVVRSEEEVVIFTGDTMFHGGCGRLFEGTPAQMHASLTSLVALGDDVRVFPGHEYTVQNLRFAKSVEPSLSAIDDALAAAEKLRAAGQPTVGTTMKLEKETNPFVRVESPELRKTLGIRSAADAAEALRVVREAKKAFL